ncbi:MAG: hypothetical protein V1746_04695, partial [bacterium]
MSTDTFSSPLKLSKEFLLEIGGWRAMQEGRMLLESGKVLSWSWEPPLLTGVVQSGASTVNARLKLGARLSDVENLCSCRQSREYGTICPHVIALGLRALKDQDGLLASVEESSPAAEIGAVEILRRIKRVPCAEEQAA